MKQIFALVVSFTITTTAFSQAGQKWSTSGNANSTGDFIGSTNNQPLIFKTNNITRGMFTSTGSFQVTSLAGTSVRLLQTDASGTLSSFTMGTVNDVLYGDGTWRPLPPVPPTLWQQNGTSLYYLNGKVGIGTKTPFTNFDVIGDAYISNNLYVGGGIIITEKVNANVEVVTSKLRADSEVATAALRADSIVMDSTKGIYGYSIFKDEVRLENKLRVVGNTQIDGNFRVNGDFIFGDNKRIGYLPASGGNPEIISFGKLPNTGVYQLLRSACNFPAAPTSYQMEGMINTYGNSVYGGNLNVLSMGFDGANGIIDMAGTNNQGGPGLLINYYCGKEVAINTGVNGGNVTMTSSTIGKVGIGKTPAYKLDVAGNVSINNNSLFLKDENHGLSQANTLSGVNINGDGPFLYGWGGGALGINHAGVYTKVLNWNENGNVGIGTDNPQTKLDVNGKISVNNNAILLRTGNDENHGLSYGNSPSINLNIDGPFLYGWGGGALGINRAGVYTKILNWNENGNVGIGTDNPQAKLEVSTDATQGGKSIAVVDNVSGMDVFRVMSNGNVFSTELTIKLKEQFPDYVFTKDYQLLPLNELGLFISKNKHLPNIPNAKDVEKNGLSVGEMQAKQMEKIEELTLYILELNKRLSSLEEENKTLKENK